MVSLNEPETVWRSLARRLSRVTLAFAVVGSLGAFAASSAWATTPLITAYAGSEASSGPPVAGPALSSPLSPTGVAVDDAGDLYVADSVNNVIEKITPSGVLSIVAGNGSSGPPSPGPAIDSPLDSPQDVAVDASGNLYIANADANDVLKVTPDGTLSVFAGTGAVGGFPSPGTATNVAQDEPDAVAVDSAGAVYIADTNGQAIEKVTPQGALTIIAGDGLTAGNPTPGPATGSALNYPEGIAVDAAGDVYIGDYGAYDVLKVTPDGQLSVIAGNNSFSMPTSGPAASSGLGGPWGVAVDAAGNLFVADYGASVVEEINTSGDLSIVAGNGQFSTPTFGGPATSSALDGPYGVAALPDDTLFVGDPDNNLIERVGYGLPGPPGASTLTAATNSAQLTFSSPEDPGTTPVTGYQVSLDGGATWQTLDVTAGANNQLTATLDSLTAGSTYNVEVRAVNASGPGAANSVATLRTTDTSPVNTSAPTVAGTPAVGQTLLAQTGAWTGTNLTYAYQWLLDGSPISGATAEAYAVTGTDAGHTISVRITATNSSGSITATTNGVQIPAPAIPAPASPPADAPTTVTHTCAKASGSLRGTTLGMLHLGQTRARARKALSQFTVHGTSDIYCLNPAAGIRVGYGSVKTLGRHTQPLAGRIVIAMTANPHYSLHGAKPGVRLAKLTHLPKLAAPIRLGANSWYLMHGKAGNYLLKVRRGVIRGIGIANRKLTGSRALTARLIRKF